MKKRNPSSKAAIVSFEEVLAIFLANASLLAESIKARITDFPSCFCVNELGRNIKSPTRIFKLEKLILIVNSKVELAFDHPNAKSRIF